MPQRAKKKEFTEKIVSQNVRGLKTDVRIEELLFSLKKRNAFAACIQETWRTGRVTLEHKQCRLILAGLEAKDVKRRRGEQGVGIVLGVKATAAWKAAGSLVYNDFGARIVAVRLMLKDDRDRDVGLFLISAYAPVGNADERLWNDFLDKLSQCKARKKKDDILLIGADMNSSMGCAESHDTEDDHRGSLGKFGLPHVNDAGIRSRSYLEVNNMIAVTTCFRKKNYATWIHPRSKLPHQIDHFLAEKHNAFRVTDAGVTEPIIDSDHRAILCKLRIKTRLKKRTPARQRIMQLDHSVLDQVDIQSVFCKEVHNRFNAHPNITCKYTKLAGALKEAAETVLPKKQRAQPGWFQADEENLTSLIAKRNSALVASFERKTRSYTHQLRDARKALKSAVSKAKNNWIVSKCNLINDACTSRRGTKESWNILNDLRKGLSKTTPSSERTMKKEDGSMCSSPEENAEVFRKHFTNLYGRTPSYDRSVLELLTQQLTASGCDYIPTDKQIKDAVGKLKKKAPGVSGLCPQLWKSLVEDANTFELLKAVIIDFWENELPPAEWEIGLLKILAKKGDLSNPGNYRGIMLLEAAYKIVAILIHERLQPIAEGLDHEAQCGFRPGRGCTDAVYTVKLAMKKRREHGQETWILFLDLVKAFDRVPRELLWEILAKFGVPVKLIRLLKSLHKNIDVKFEVNDISHTINCIIGVKQGDILGPVLFTIFIAAVMITWRAAYDRPLCMFRSKEDFVMTGRRHQAKGLEFPVEDSEYADDTAVLFASRQLLEESTPLLLEHFKRFGMEVHVGHIEQPDKPSKTNILFVAAPASTYKEPATFDNQDFSNVELGAGKYLPIVDKVCYLGTILTRNCTDAADVKSRIESAGKAFGALRKCLFANANVSFAAKNTVYNGLILAILLYGSESWCLTEKLYDQLRVFHARCIRGMCRVNRWHTRKHHISNNELLQRVGLRSMDVYITRKQLGWAGHVVRMKFDRFPRRMLSSWVAAKRPHGAPEFTYGRGLSKCLKKAKISKSDWHLLAQNRNSWRDIIKTVN